MSQVSSYTLTLSFPLLNGLIMRNAQRTAESEVNIARMIESPNSTASVLPE